MEEKCTIFDVIKQGNIKIKKIYGLDSRLDLEEINPLFYSEKYSILILRNYSITNNDIEGELNKLEKINVEKSFLNIRILSGMIFLVSYIYRSINWKLWNKIIFIYYLKSLREKL